MVLFVFRVLLFLSLYAAFAPAYRSMTSAAPALVGDQPTCHQPLTHHAPQHESMPDRDTEGESDTEEMELEMEALPASLRCSLEKIDLFFSEKDTEPSAAPHLEKIQRPPRA